MRSRFVVSLLIFLTSTLGLLSPLSSAAASPELSLTFAIDSSGSMRGNKINQIRASISAIINNLETPARISVVTFANKSQVLISQSQQSGEVVDALKEIRPGGNTSLYDGIELAFQNTENSKNSVVIVFSDGEDNYSKQTVQKISGLVDNFSGLSVFIGLGNSPNLAKRLSEVAGIRGKVISVKDINQLTEVLNTSIKPAVTSSLRIEKAKVDEAAENYYPILALLVFALAVLLISAWFLLRTTLNRRSNLELIKAYDAREATSQEKSIFFRLMRIPVLGNYAKKEEKRLLAAGITISIRTWLYAQIGIFLALAFFFQTTGFSSFVSVLFAGSLGFGLGTIYLNFIRAKKAAAFADELPDTLTIIASSLQSGLSFTQALTSVARESDGEVALQFRRVLSEVQVGRNLIDSLQDVAERMDSQDFRWTISALTIQREIGGNLSDILTTTAEAIRGRAEIRNEIRALSAEGRVSAYVLIALPVLMLLYIRVTKPDSFDLMFSTTPGIVMMSIVGVLMVIGWVWVQKVVNIKLT